MPGMAASPRIFEYLSFPEAYEVVYLSWMPPQKNEPIAMYAKRMSDRITHERPILLGVSFGGILVQEIAKIRLVSLVIIVSSVKSNLEFPSSMRVAKKTGAHKLLPTQWIKNLESLALQVFGDAIKARVDSYQKYLSERDPDYLDWSIDTMVHWTQTDFDPNTVHIHGDADTVFPFKYLDTSNRFYQLPKATHAMILTHHKWFNTHLPNIIKQHAHED